MMKLSKRIEELLERHDFSVCGEISERTYNNDGYDVELETYSPEGEDVIVSLTYDGTEEDFIRQFRSYAEGFDAEEHAEMWIEGRGKNGVPDSIKDLLEDAEWQKEMLLEVAKELSGRKEETKEKNLTKVKCLNCGKEFDLWRLEHDKCNLEGFYTSCVECGASFDIDFNPANTFITDVAKMADFKVLTMEEFLETYSYITEDEYEATRLYLNWLNADDSEP